MYETYPYLIPVPLIYINKFKEMNTLITNWDESQDNYEKIFKPLGVRRHEMPIVMKKVLSIDHMLGKLDFTKYKFIE